MFHRSTLHRSTKTGAGPSRAATRSRLLLGCLGLIALALPQPARADPPGGRAGWAPTFADEFNNTPPTAASPNPSVNTKAWFPSPVYLDGNGQPQGGVEWYRPSNFLPIAYYRVQNVFEDGHGNLALNTYREDYDPHSDNFYAYGLQHYTSAWMVTRNFQQAYGYFEVRLKVASTPGLDTAFWLLKGGARDPEVDICEHPSGDRVFNGDGKPPTGAGYAVSQGLIPDGAPSVGKLTLSSTRYSADYHTYGLDWQPGRMVWYVDGAETFRTTTNVPDQALHVLLGAEVERDTDQLTPGTLQQGPPYGQRKANPDGSFFGDPDKGRYPAATLVDWVRVWQKLPKREAGKQQLRRPPELQQRRLPGHLGR